jgi:hypothetical protein
MHLLVRPGKWRFIFIGIGGYLIISLIYYLIFKQHLKSMGIEASGRTSVHINVFDKIKFLMGKAMSSSFHFTFLVNEKSIAGRIIYLIMFVASMAAYQLHLKGFQFLQRIKQLALILLLLFLVYLPSLIVKENYASNRTLLALNMAVFLFVIITIAGISVRSKTLKLVLITASVLFIVNAWYNLHVLFLRPVTKEYVILRNAIDRGYKLGIDTVFFVRPMENTFEKKYGITRSWDEFGVPSSFFNWVPEFFVKQVVFEKTRDRALAEKLVVKNWLGTSEYLTAGEKASATTLVINADQLLSVPHK